MLYGFQLSVYMGLLNANSGSPEFLSFCLFCLSNSDLFLFILLYFIRSLFFLMRDKEWISMGGVGRSREKGKTIFNKRKKCKLLILRSLVTNKYIYESEKIMFS